MGPRFHAGRATRVARVTGATAIASLAIAAPAHALLGGLLGNTTSAVTSTVNGTTSTLVPSVGGLLTGQQGVLPTASQLLCPTATGLSQILNTPGLGENGVGTIGQGLATLTCSAGLLEYKFETTWKRANGTTVSRSHTAVVGVPTALNVDDDVLADLTGTITITGNNQVGVELVRAFGETSTLPVSVQAVLRDQTRRTLGRSQIAFGYDALDDRAPGRFTLGTPIDTIARPNGTYTFNLSQTARGEKIALVAGIYDGTTANPVNPTRVRLAYGASPDTAAITARAGDEVQATLTQNRVGPATLSASVVDGQSVDEISAQINNLPSSLGLTARTSGNVQATYTASARVAAIRASLVSKVAGTTAQKTMLNLDDVPTGFTAAVNDDGGSVQTTGGAIGLTEVGFANGEPKFLAGEPAYLNLDDDGTVSSTALRIPGIQRATFSLAGGAPRVSAKIAATPLLARIKDPGRTITARVLNLPSEFDLSVDPQDFEVDFDGKGTGIGRIVLNADSTQPLVGRATKIRGTIEGIPARTIASLVQDGDKTGFKVEGGGALGKVELVASNGSEALPVGTSDGVVYRDVPGGEFRIAARVRELREVGIDTGDGTTLNAVTKGGPFSLDVRTADLEAGGQVLDLPARATFGIDDDAAALRFTGADADGDPQGIDRIAVTARAVGGTLFGRADRIDADVRGLPAEVELGLQPNGDDFTVQSSAPIGSIELVAANRLIDRAADLPAGDVQGVRYTDRTGGDFVVGARIRELRRIAADLGDELRISTETAGGVFRADIDTDDLTGSAQITELPAKSTITANLDDLRIGFRGRTAGDEPQGIDALDLNLRTSGALVGRANQLKGHIEDIAPDLTLDLDQADDGIKVTASEPIGLIELAAADRPVDLVGDLPADGANGVRYVDRPAGFVAGARIRGLRSIDVGLQPSVSLTAKTAGGPFDVEVDTADLTARGAIRDLPADVQVGFDQDAGKLTFAGKNADGDPQGIESVALNVRSAQPLVGRATRIDLGVKKLAPNVTIDLADGGTGASVVASDPIEELTLGATDAADAVDVDATLGTPQGAVLRDTPAGYVLAARLLDLREVTVNLSGDDVGLTSKLRSTPFRVLVASPGLDVDAQIENLPAHTDLTADLGAGRLTLDGHGDGVDRVALTATSATPLFGRASRLQATILDLPSKIAVELDDSGTGASVVAGDDGDAAIGSLELLASDGATALPAPLDDTTRQGAIYRDRAGEPFVLAARIRELRKLTAAFSGEVGLEARTAGGPFAIDVDTADVAAQADILDLPANAKLGLGLDDGEITFDGTNAEGDDQGIELLTLNARLAQPILGEGNRIKARIEKLPAHVTLGFAQDAGGASLTADQPIQLIEIQAWEDGKPEPALPADQGAILKDRDGQDFELAARVRQLKKLNLDTSDAVQLRTETAGGVFTADIDTESLQANAVIDQLPEVLDLALNLEDGQVTYNGSAPVNRISVAIGSEEPVFLGGTDFAVDFRQVPTQFALTIGQDLDESITLESSQPIGQIDVTASSPDRDAPVIPDGEAGALLDSTDGQLGLALRVFDLQKLEVNTDPITLEATMRPDTPFRVDAKLDAPAPEDGSPVDPDAAPLRVQAEILNLPQTFRVALGDVNPAGSATTGGSKLTYQATSVVGSIRIKADGIQLLEGAEGVEAAITSVPQSFTLTLPEQPETGPKPPLAQLAVGGGQAIGELRLAAGSRQLPATGQPNDLFSYDGDPANFGVGVRLSALQGLSMNLDPVNIALDQVEAQTKPIELNATLPQDGADATVTGLLNKPSNRTEVGVILPVNDGDPTRLVLRNGQAGQGKKMGALTLNVANLGTIPSANFSLTNIPEKLNACLATDGACRPADRLPAPLGDYVRSNANFIGYRERPDMTLSGTAGGQNRPFASQVSLDFDDQGTSGNSAAISSMITMNATIDLGDGGQPVQVQNVRFHRLALDFGQSTPFGYLTTTVPRLYLFVDSQAKPFVLGNIRFPPDITQFRLGSDGNPAIADRRLVWLPGRRGGGSLLDPRATGSLDCKGTKSLESGGIDLLNFPIAGQLVPVCSAG